MGLEMTNIHLIHKWGGGFYKGVTLSRGVLVPINRENRGVTV